jgi:hypothetical protein
MVQVENVIKNWLKIVESPYKVGQKRVENG